MGARFLNHVSLTKLGTRVLLGLFFVNMVASCTSKKNEVVAEVGRFKISQYDVERRDEIIKLGTPAVTESYGLLQLVKAYKNAQVMENNGRKITPELVLAEEQRIDKNTKMPEVLAQIKAFFKGDMDAYRRVYVLPNYADSAIYFDFFNNSPHLQQPAKKTAEDFLSQILANPSAFSAESKNRNLAIQKFRVSLYEGIIREWKDDSANSKVPEDIQKNLKEAEQRQASVEGQVWVQNIIPGLKPGQIYSKLIENGEGWMVARYLKPVLKKGPKTVPKTDPTYEFEGIQFPRRNFDAWFADEEKKVEVKILKSGVKL